MSVRLHQVLLAAIATAALLGAATLIAVAASPAHATYPGKNGYIYFTAFSPDESGHFDLWRIRPDGTGIQNVSDRPGGPGQGSWPSISANGKIVAFETNTQATSEIWTMNSDGSNFFQVTNNAVMDVMPSINPAGTRMAFVSTRENPHLDYDIWSENRTGLDPLQVLNGWGEDYFPDYSPDGQTIVMSSEVTGMLQIAKTPATGGPFANATALTEVPAFRERYPSVSPDGQKVLFVGQVSGSSSDGDLFTVPIGGGARTPVLVGSETSPSYPAFSPDGKRMVFNDLDGDGLTVASANGANRVLLDISPATFPGKVAWAADNTAPKVKLKKKPKRQSTKRSVAFKFTANESGSTFRCKLDKRKWKTCKSPAKFKVATGKHVFRVRATDFAGNTGKSVTFHFTRTS